MAEEINKTLVMVVFEIEGGESQLERQQYAEDVVAEIDFNKEDCPDQEVQINMRAAAVHTAQVLTVKASETPTGLTDACIELLPKKELGKNV